MAIDNKYGKVTTEFGTIAEDEPVVVFRARDALLLDLLREYHEMCATSGSPLHHLNLIDESFEMVKSWQAENETQTPNSNAYVDRMAGRVRKPIEP